MDPIVTLQGEALRNFLDYMVDAVHMGQMETPPLRTLRIAIDDGGVKVKLNEYTWSRAMGEVQ